MDEIKVSSLMNSSVVTSVPSETLSKVLAKMSNNSLHELPIVDKNNFILGYFGFDVLSRKKHIPLFTRVDRLMVVPPKVMEENSIHDAAKIMLETGFRALPVVDGNKILKGVISRTDIIKAVSRLKGSWKETASEVMTPDPELLSYNDEVEKALRLMNELNELCAPVLDREGRIAGGVLIDDISRSMWRWEEGVYPGDVVGENFKHRVEIDAFVTPIATVSGGEGFRDVCEKMGAVNPYLCAVEDDDKKPLGVITQYDILKNIVSYQAEKGVFVDISGLDIKDPFVYSSVVSKIERFVKKVGEFSWITPYNLGLHVVSHDKGGRVKFSIRARLSTDKGLIYVKSHGWDILRCFDDIVEWLTKRILDLKPR